LKFNKCFADIAFFGLTIRAYLWLGANLAKSLHA